VRRWISQNDPGVANWLDTVGVNSGTDGLIRDFRLVKLSEVAAMTHLPRVTPEQRSVEIAARAAAYASRAT
jgi:hypothetical protein